MRGIKLLDYTSANVGPGDSGQFVGYTEVIARLGFLGMINAHSFFNAPDYFAIFQLCQHISTNHANTSGVLEPYNLDRSTLADFPVLICSVASRITSGFPTLRSGFWPETSALVVCGRESPFGRKFELMCQSPESCLIAYRVVTREYHCRSQERVAFSQSGL